MRFIGIIFTLFIVTGCVSNALSTQQTNGGEILGYSGAQYFVEIQARANENCTTRGLGLARIISTRSAAWGNTIYQFACYRPEIKTLPVEQPERTKQQIREQKPQNFSVEDAKRKCLDLGIKAGTEQYGKCVLQLSK